MDQLVQDMLDQGVVEASQSPWASPIVLVQKKDGGVRFFGSSTSNHET